MRLSMIGTLILFYANYFVLIIVYFNLVLTKIRNVFIIIRYKTFKNNRKNKIRHIGITRYNIRVFMFD